MVLILALFAGAGWAETLYDYDADGRLLSATAGGDFSILDPTPVHNLSDVMVMGDANTNGMPDSLEAYLAGNWGSDYDPMTCDSDGDGVCDWNEWMVGSDPFSANSQFSSRFVDSQGEPTEPFDVTFSWPSVPFKIYSVQWTCSLLDDSWTVLVSNLVATPPLNSWTHENATNDNGFYRIFSEGGDS